MMTPEERTKYDEVVQNAINTITERDSRLKLVRLTDGGPGEKLGYEASITFEMTHPDLPKPGLLLFIVSKVIDVSKAVESPIHLISALNEIEQITMAAEVIRRMGLPAHPIIVFDSITDESKPIFEHGGIMFITMDGHVGVDTSQLEIKQVEVPVNPLAPPSPPDTPREALNWRNQDRSFPSMGGFPFNLQN